MIFTSLAQLIGIKSLDKFKVFGFETAINVDFSLWVDLVKYEGKACKSFILSTNVWLIVENNRDLSNSTANHIVIINDLEHVSQEIFI